MDGHGTAPAAARSADLPVRRREVRAAVGAVVPGVVTVAAFGLAGLAGLKSDVDRLTGGDIATVRAVGDLATVRYETEQVPERAAGPTRQDRLEVTLDQILVPTSPVSATGRNRIVVAGSDAGEEAVLGEAPVSP